MNNFHDKINELRFKWGKIERVDPDGDGFNKLVRFLDSLPDETIKGLVYAKIKWVSSLALNRAVSRGLI